jgi:predicted RNA-binding Zn-ribbon protein involved in translation (DUF1610 family)
MDLSRISKKNPYEDFRMTLSAIDNKTIHNFDKYYETSDDKKKILIQLIRKKNSIRIKYSNEYHDLCKKISELEKEIEYIDNQTKKIDYLLRASSHFLEYAKQNTDSTQEKEIINGFFITKDGSNRGQICKNYVKECIGDGYSLNTNSHEFNASQELTCIKCNVEKLTNPRESYASCPKCGEVTKYQDSQNNKGEYSEEVEVLSPFAYKRINHFKEWISTLIAREGTGPPQEIIDELLRELKKDKIETREEVTEERIKGYLKKLKHSKLYDHIPAIIFKLCGVAPPQISPQLEAKLIEMFQQIQNPFEKHAPANRKNFLSYSFCIHKLLELLGQTHLLDKLPLLKSREKLYQQDLIWKGVCSELSWRFFASL